MIILTTHTKWYNLHTLQFPIQPKRKILYNLIHLLHKIKFNYRVSARKIQLSMLPIFHIEKIDITVFDQD